jgi:hypothetical protein
MQEVALQVEAVADRRIAELIDDDAQAPLAFQPRQRQFLEDILTDEVPVEGLADLRILPIAQGLPDIVVRRVGEV